MFNELFMAELLCTRLCHDLTGPIGAVNNGAEFLSEEGFNLQNQAVELITSSAFSAVTRLQFYRMAYGRVRDHGEASLSDKQKMATDFFADTKITLDWPDSHADASGIAVSHRMSRLIYNLLIVASGALVRGGTLGVRITQPAANQKQLTITAEGPLLKWEPDIEAIYTGENPPDELTPKNVQAVFTRKLADELEARVVCKQQENNLTLTLVQTLPTT